MRNNTVPAAECEHGKDGPEPDRCDGRSEPRNEGVAGSSPAVGLDRPGNEPFLAAGGPANLSSLPQRGAIDEVPASSSENTFNGINVGRNSTGNLITGRPGQRQRQ